MSSLPNELYDVAQERYKIWRKDRPMKIGEARLSDFATRGLVSVAEKYGITLEDALNDILENIHLCAEYVVEPFDEWWGNFCHEELEAIKEMEQHEVINDTEQ